MCLDCLRKANKAIERCDKMLAEVRLKKNVTKNLVTKAFLSTQEREIENLKKEAECDRINWLMMMN